MEDISKMKNSKYIFLEYKNFLEPPPDEFNRLIEDQRKEGKYIKSVPMFGLDSKILPGAFILSVMIFTEKHGNGPVLSELEHNHDFDEAWIFMGTDMSNPTDLGGEIDFWLEDDHFIIDKSCMIYVPAGMKRGPCGLSRCDRPIIFFQAANEVQYSRTWEGTAEGAEGKGQ